MEKWRDIEGYEGLYQVSSLGNVKSLNYNHTGKEKNMKPVKNSHGYMIITTHKNGTQKSEYVAVFVARAFPETCGKWFEGAVVDHINTIKTDNRAVNLRVCTHKQNSNNPLTIQHISESKKGDKNPNWGVKRTEISRQRQSESLKKIYKEHPETFKNFLLSEKNQYKKKIKIKQIDIETNMILNIWDSAADVERELGICHSNISACCKGKYKSAGGYKWEYK